MSYQELAYLDYKEGMKYKDIADKYSVSINTVKSWKKRHNWSRDILPIATPDAPEPEKEVSKPEHKRLQLLRKAIEDDLKKQLSDKRITGRHYHDLISDYMSLWDIKNMLIEDIDNRGVVVTWNGNLKKNDSVSELNKTNAQMLKLLSELGLKVSDVNMDGDEYAGDV